MLFLFTPFGGDAFSIILKPKSMTKTKFFFFFLLKELRESVKVDLAIKKKRMKKNTQPEMVEVAKRRIK